MARPKNIIPRWIPVDVFELNTKQAEMSNDSDFGAFCRKAVLDFMSGCRSADVDPSVKERYDYAYSRMARRQKINADAYQATKNSTQHNTTRGKTKTTTAGAAAGNTAENCTTGLNGSGLLESPTPAAVVEFKQAYGENKKVLLTVEQGQKLRESYGENLELAIDILDTYAINNPRKFAKYESHYDVLKKSGWVWDKVQEKLTASARLNKAQTQPKSFAAQERERAAAGATYLLSLEGVV